MAEIFYGLIVIVCYGLLCLKNTEASRCIYDREEVLQRLNSLRGMLAVEIVIGHVVIHNNLILFPFHKFMIISVSFFFFVSAFGMSVSYENKKGYLKNFYLKPLYLLALIVVFYLYNIVIGFFFPKVMDAFGFSQFGRNILGITNWYMWELLIFYLLFWIAYAVSEKYAAAAITTITITGAIIAFQYGASECWYASAFAFPLGLIVGKYYHKFIRLLNSPAGGGCTLILIILGFGRLLLPNDSIIGMLFLRNVIGIGVIFLLIYISGYFRLGNRMSQMLCKYSTEIYLSQFIYLAMANVYIRDYKVRLVFVLCMTLLTAWLLHPLTGKIRMVMR